MANKQCIRQLRYLYLANDMADAPGSILSAPRESNTGVASRARDPADVFDHTRCAHFTQNATVYTHGLALVRGHARARDRDHPSRTASARRSLHLFAAGRLLPRGGVGRLSYCEP